MSDTKNVSSGKPAISGSVYEAPLGTKLPTSAIEELDEAFKELGYVSDSGLKNSTKKSTGTKKAWGGDTVLTTTNGQDDTFKFNLIEPLNPDVLKFVYGDDNVSGTLDTGIKIKVNANSGKDRVMVFDMILQGGHLKRIVVPQGNITEIGEITYKDDDLIGYDTTMAAKADAEGNTHYEYINKKNK